MALPIPPINPNTQIPNNPFYYPETNYLKGEYGPFIVGSGFLINNNTGTIEVSGGGSGAPTILAGTGIAVTAGTGTVTIANTGILTVTAGAGISVSVAGGNLNIVNTAPAPAPGTYGTVTSVTAGAGLAGGTITSSGTISLATVGTVSPGTYNNATITVDAYGRVTYAAPGSGTGSAILATAPLAVTSTFPQTISIQSASTAAAGAVQLNTSTSSTSTTQAATPSAVKQAYDLAVTASSDAATALSTATGASAAASTAQSIATAAQGTATAAQTAATNAQGTATAAATSAAAAQAIASAAIPCSSFTAKGQLLAATGPSTFNALPPGTNGQVLIACSSCTSGLTWSSQPIAAGTVTSVGTGIGLLGGPITSTGTISLAPTAVTPGTYTYANIAVDTYGRITSAGSGVPPIPCSVITGKGVVLTGTAANAPTALPSGPNGYVLTACSACATGLTWAVASSSGIPTSAIAAKGALITGTAPGTVSTLPVGSNGFVLTADSACADGLKWAAAAAPTVPATPSTEGVVYASTKNSASFATSLGFNALNTTVTGVGNVALGSSSGCALTSGQFNTFVGSGAGCATTTGCNNIALGSQTLNAQTTGCCNIAIGNLAGINLTTESGNVIVGPYQGVAGCDNNVYIADGTGTLRVRVNESGAIAIGGSGYGAAGQVLTSAGTTGSPTWTTVASSGGTVTSITLGSGLCGPSNPITTTGTIDLCNTGVTAATYTNATVTVDVKGRITAANSGLPPLTALTGTSPIGVTAGTTPVVSICSASTTNPGAVQLYDNVDSTSTTLALTAAQGKNLQDQITALAVNPSITLAGTINADTGGIVESVTSAGALAGYVVGNTLPAADATTVDTYVIVTTPGTMTPPGGSPTAATRGDWFLVSETSPGVYAWTFLNVGFDVSYATTTSSGVVCLATNAQAQAGTNTITALTPAAAASAYIPKACITAKGTLITGTATDTPTALPLGLNTQYLQVNTACPTGLEWVVGMGDTPVGTVNWFAATTAPLGWLVADGRAVSRTLYSDLFGKIGTTYGTGDGSTTFNLPDLRGQFVRGWDAAGGTARGCDPGRAFGSSQGFALQNHCHWLEVFGGTAGRPEWACPNTACPTGASYPAAVAGPGMSTAGFTSTNGSSETRPMNVAMLPCIKWQVTTAPSSCGIPCSCITAKGTIITGDAPNNPVSLPVGTDGQALVACAACPTGLTWTTPAVPVSAATPTVAGTVLGCTITTNTALGCNALLAVPTGCFNTAVGASALLNLGAGCFNVGVGGFAVACNVSGFHNVGVGVNAARNALGCNNTAVGHNTMFSATGGCNTVFGFEAGCAITTGESNVAIGPSVQVASPTGSCQLAIGFSATCNWLTGDSNKNIQPGAGIRDCTGALGTAGQILSSTGSAIQWRSGCVQQTASCTANVTLATEITNRKLVNGDSLTIFNSNVAVPPVAITLTATALTNSQTYPTQATTTVFTLPSQGSVTLILSDSATNSWYIESYDTPEQAGTVVVKATMSTSVTVTAATKLAFNVATVNPQGYFNTTTNRFQPLVAGYYQVNAQIYGTASDWMYTDIRKNGVSEILSEQTSGANAEAVPAAGIVYMNGSTDYLEVWSQAGGAGASLNVNPATTYFTASLINQTNTRVVGIDAVARMEVSAGNIANNNAIVEVVPGTNGVSLVTNTEWNPQGWFNPTNGRFTPTIPGYYQVDAYATSNNSNFNTWAGIFKNGNLLGQAIAPTGGGGNWQTSLYSTVVFMNGSTDYLRLGAASQGAVTGFITQTSMSGMSISLVGANQAQPIPPMTWINAGTVQSVGFNAINIPSGTPGTAPTITASTQNNIRYRQIGPKEWEVQGVLYFTNGTAGSGDYILTLPGGLQFDITSPYQLPYTQTPNDGLGWGAYGLINGWAVFSQTGATSYQQSLIMPYDATRYRIFPYGPSTLFWSNGYYSMGAYPGFRKWGFTFFTP